MDRCPHPKCSADDNITCWLGHIKLANCPEWKKVVPTSTTAQPNPDELAVPWSGSALGESDLNFISGRGKPITVGIVGPESAGKTTVLAAFYVASGVGVTVMPASSVDGIRADDPLLRVKHFASPAPTRRVGLVWRSSFPRHKAIDTMRRALLDCKLPGTQPAR